ncbi:unnamed protein product, partial [Closterium sp. NIES-54]
VHAPTGHPIARGVRNGRLYRVEIDAQPPVKPYSSPSTAAATTSISNFQQ